MTNVMYPKLITVFGSGGESQYCSVTGEAVIEPYRNKDFVFSKIDLKEYLEYWLHLDVEGTSLEIGVCDIGGWNGLGAYVEPEFDFRAEALYNRTELLDGSDPKHHVFELVMSSSGGLHEVKVKRYIIDMAPIPDGEATVGRWIRIDHAYSTARALCRLLGVNGFTVQV